MLYYERTDYMIFICTSCLKIYNRFLSIGNCKFDISIVVIS